MDANPFVFLFNTLQFICSQCKHSLRHPACLNMSIGVAG